jgi:uncharacterized protein
MNSFILNKIDRLKEICEKHSVSTLYVFGSVLSEKFKSTSDLDFAVLFQDKLTPFEHGDAFLELMDDLQKLYHRNIDLVSYRVIKNPIFKAELDRTKQVVYAAA